MPQNPTPAAAGDTNPTTPMPGEDAIREQVRRLLATADGFSPDGLEPHDYQDHASVVLDMIRPLVGRVAELEAAPSPATVLRQVADKWAAHCPEHSDAEDVWMDCPEDWVFELRRAADDRAEGGAL